MTKDARSVLIVIDVQNDFCAEGALAVPDGDAVVPLINGLNERFPHRILTQDWHPAGHHSFASSHAGKAPFELQQVEYGEQVLWPDHCVQGTRGAQFHDELDVTGAELILRKGFRREIDSYSAFFENDRKTSTGLGGYLRERGIRRIHLAGLATDFCVAYSAIDGVREGFDVTVIDKACRAIDLDGSLAKAWQDMESVGVKRDVG